MTIGQRDLDVERRLTTLEEAVEQLVRSQEKWSLAMERLERDLSRISGALATMSYVMIALLGGAIAEVFHLNTAMVIAIKQLIGG